jgi:hypothetical protein
MTDAERLRIQAELGLDLALQVPDENVAEILMRLATKSLAEADDLERRLAWSVRQQGSQAA